MHDIYPNFRISGQNPVSTPVLKSSGTNGIDIAFFKEDRRQLALARKPQTI